MKLKLTIAYDGANYAGWQTQKNSVGVQQRIEEAVAKIFPGASHCKAPAARTQAFTRWEWWRMSKFPPLKLKCLRLKSVWRSTPICRRTSA